MSLARHLLRPAACALALSGCASHERSSPVCEREVNNDPKVQALQMEILGNLEGNGLRRSSLDAVRRQAMARCLRHEGGGPAGGVASPEQRPGLF